MKVSILIPVFNEADNLRRLHDEISEICESQPWEAEVVYVDDGSDDGSAEILDELAERDERCQVLRFSRNFGQTAAMSAAIEYATGDVIVPMDADLQNDPADIPRLLSRLDEGFDVVSGWRRDRQDKLLTRRVPSICANRLLGWWTGVKLHDFGCTLKAYRAEVIKGTRLYGEMHRFVPVYASWRGARVTELEVNHRARRFGESKYGPGRAFKVLLDMLTLKLLGSYSTKPSYLFGGMGALCIALGLLAFAGVLVEKLVWDAWPHKMSALLMVTMLITVGALMILMGLLAELIVRTYHEAQGKPTYVLLSELRSKPDPPTDQAPPDGAEPATAPDAESS